MVILLYLAAEFALRSRFHCENIVDLDDSIDKTVAIAAEAAPAVAASELLSLSTNSVVILLYMAGIFAGRSIFMVFT